MANEQTETAAAKRKRLAEEKKQKEEAEKVALAEAKRLKGEKEELEKAEKVAIEEAKKAEAAIKKAEAEAAKAEADALKKAEAEKAKTEANASRTLAQLAEDYNLKRIKGLWIPALFHQSKGFSDLGEEQVEAYHARNFLFGMEIFAEQGSVSGKITYVGPNRRYTLHNVQIAIREARPTQNNWKTFNAPVRMFKRTEHKSKLKDPKVLRDLLFSKGGQANFSIRFVQDKEFTQEEVKKKVFAKDPVRLKNLNYRIKKDQATLGIKPVLRNKEEALLLLSDMRAVKDNKSSHVIKFLQDEISKYSEAEVKEKAESKKD